MIETPLAELVSAFERDGTPPPGWTDDSLRRAWEGCQDISSLTRLASRMGRLDACAAAQVAAAHWARHLIPAGARRATLDYATREAAEALDEAFANVAACDGGDAHATETLLATCEAIVRAAGLRDWDELYAEAALCDGAPWPDPAYAAMVAQREAAEQATRNALAAIVRAHVLCPTVAQLLEGYRP